LKNKKIRNVSVDIEADGPAPGIYSMVCFGAVIVEPGFNRTFYGKLKPISSEWIPDALAISGFTREETSKFDDPYDVMLSFEEWIKDNIDGRPILWADNNGFDAAFINYYFHRYLGRNPFGWSSSNIGSLYKGVVKDIDKKFTHLRRTVHSHNPVDDAKGNAEALLSIFNMMKKGA
jgi:DNA polymerase III alpha subunit (gram-positive type)